MPRKPRSNSKRGRPIDPSLPARRRDEILACATALFARSGYANADLSSIARRLDIGKGTIYRYFPSKEELFRCALMRELDGLLAETVQATADLSDDLDVIRGMTTAYFVGFSRRPALIELLTIERAEFPKNRKPTFFVYRDRNLPQWRARFVRLMRSGRIRRMDVDTIIAGFGSLVYGAATSLRYLLPGRTLEDHAAGFTTLLFHGITTSRGADARTTGSRSRRASARSLREKSAE